MTDKIQLICIKTGMMDNNSWLVKNTSNGEGFLVDASFSPDIIIKKIKEAGVKLKGILITHCHYDHIYSVNEIKKEFYSDGILVYAGEDEKELISDRSFNLFRKHGLSLESVEADRFLQDGEIIDIAGIKVKAIFTPGHTKGGVCYYLESEKLVFTGDTLFEGSYGRTDLPSGSIKEICESVTSKLFTLPDETMVFPGHGNPTDIGYESKTNPILNVSCQL